MRIETGLGGKVNLAKRQDYFTSRHPSATHVDRAAASLAFITSEGKENEEQWGRESRMLIVQV